MIEYWVVRIGIWGFLLSEIHRSNIPFTPSAIRQIEA